MAKIQIYQGEERDITIRLKEKGTTKEFPINGVTEITVNLRAATGGNVTKTLSASGITVLSEDAGKFSVNLTETDTAALLDGEDLPIQAVVDIGSVRRIRTLENALDVISAELP